MRKQGEKELQIKISTASRYPKENDAYDKQAHRYKESYVHPKSWQLTLSTELPKQWQQCEWRIKGSDSDFEEVIVQDRESARPGFCFITLPSEGHYEISLEVQMQDGRCLIEDEPYHLQDFLFVALGDSYFCGEGSPDEPGKPSPVIGPLACNLATFMKFLEEKVDAEVPMEREPVWQEKEVHRSYRSGVSKAVRRLEDNEPGQLITFLNFARSGASIKKGLFAPRDQDDWTTIGQIEEAKATIGERPIDVLLISAGGNDIHFSDRLLDLLREDIPIFGEGDDELVRKRELAKALEYLADLPGRFERLAEAVQEMKPRQVFITPYPLSQFEVMEEDGSVTIKSGCGIFDAPSMGVDEKDAQVMKETGEKLNKAIQEAAEKHGWHYVEAIVEEFAGHGRCSNDKYYYSAEESCFNQGDFLGTLHPNEKGTEVYADCIVRAVREKFWSD